MHAQGAKNRTSTSASLRGMQQQHATPPTTATDQIRFSTDVGGVMVEMQQSLQLTKGHTLSIPSMSCRYASCKWLLHTVSSTSTGADPELVGGGGIYINTPPTGTDTVLALEQPALCCIQCKLQYTPLI